MRFKSSFPETDLQLGALHAGGVLECALRSKHYDRCEKQECSERKLNMMKLQRRPRPTSGVAPGVEMVFHRYPDFSDTMRPGFCVPSRTIH